MKIIIFPNLNKSNAEKCVIETCEILHNLKVDIFIDSQYSEVFSEYRYIVFDDFEKSVKQCDAIIVIGGDGTILKCSKIVAPFHKPILGINSGRLGFMASIESNELSYLKNLVEGNYTIVKRMMIKGVINFKDGRKFEQSALNDIVVARAPFCKIADFEVSMNNYVISSLRADGLIFSTPTGATAYSLSAGGPIIEPDMECIEFTQICPFSLFARTMIFSSEKTLKVCYSSAKDTDVVISFDGNEEIPFSTEDELYISKSNNYIYLIDFNGSNFYNSVNKKLMKPLKEENEAVK